MVSGFYIKQTRFVLHLYDSSAAGFKLFQCDRITVVVQLTFVAFVVENNELLDCSLVI